MSTAQANLFGWKQEVNRRLAEHRSRKGASSAGPREVEAEHRNGSRRGAEAAARVAQRFAHAPSYLDILMQQPQVLPADETRWTSGERKSTAQPVAAAPETTRHPAPPWQSVAETHAPAAVEALTSAEEPASIGYAVEPRESSRLFGGAAATQFPETPAQEWGATDEVRHAEAEPMHANLIEFPRELVATRKIRPRLVDGPQGARNAQLSIFEVDPEAISTQAEPAEMKVALDWSQPEWSGIKLDAQPVEESSAAAVSVVSALEIEQAPLSRRLLALFVDVTLITAALIGAGAVSAYNAASLPGPHAMGTSALFGFLAAAVLYELMFLTLARATPGMRYAHIALTTFGNEQPSREQRQRRLAVTALSVLPVGLGLLWSLFDEERLCWHDRLSQTYLKCS
ncbi:MAG: RDD family protein [Terracidiphilus sp.]